MSAVSENQRKKTSEVLHQELRVNHVGEMGAYLIYEEQVRCMRRKGVCSEVVAVFEKALEEERDHFVIMEDFLKKHEVRPSLLIPIWRVCAKLAARFSVLLGVEVAFLFTRAVEEVVVQHYVRQIHFLKKHECLQEIAVVVEGICAEELAHHDEALESCQEAKFPYISLGMKLFSKIAILMSKKI